jgi:prepilin-type N-terminal cleavage/methylation domain-containing protein
MFSRFLQFKGMFLPHTARSGFGMIELMVSIAIVTIVMAVVLARQSSFNDAVLLRGQAYDIALSMREVQLKAVSAIDSTGTGGDNFRTVLGVHFDESTSGTYRIFQDKDSDNFYDCTSPTAPSCEEFGLQNKLDTRFQVTDIRTTPAGAMSGTDLSIVFQRPNFDARFFDASNAEVFASMVEIDVENPVTGEIRTIEITPTGQIAVLDS